MKSRAKTATALFAGAPILTLGFAFGGEANYRAAQTYPSQHLRPS